MFFSLHFSSWSNHIQISAFHLCRWTNFWIVIWTWNCRIGNGRPQFVLFTYPCTEYGVQMRQWIHVIYGNDLLQCNQIKQANKQVYCANTSVYIRFEAQKPNDNGNDIPETTPCIVCVSNKNLCTLLLLQEQWWVSFTAKFNAIHHIVRKMPPKERVYIYFCKDKILH